MADGTIRRRGQEGEAHVRSPAPTAAPVVVPRDAKTPVMAKLRIREDEVKARLKKRGGMMSSNDIVLGPFRGRSKEEVEALKREIGLDLNNIKRSDAAFNAQQWLKREGQQEGSILERSLGIQKRQTADEQSCFVGNGKLSCYPTTGLHVEQGTWSKVSVQKGKTERVEIDFAHLPLGCSSSGTRITLTLQIMGAMWTYIYSNKILIR
jgi:hypothetical protein